MKYEDAERTLSIDRLGTISAISPRSNKSIDYIPRYSKSQYYATKHQIENVEAKIHLHNSRFNVKVNIENFA